VINSEIIVLCWTAATIGFVHTALGPDHYLPFIMMSKARGWTTTKTVWITLLSGSGHVMSSVLLGLAGVFLGTELMKLKAFEAFRGSLAAWLLIGFGFAYFVWGLWRAIKNKKHTHTHIHEDGVVHSHPHVHTGSHAHVHDEKSNARDITPWILFTVFVLGPCESLIPLIMYPAAKSSMAGMYLVTIIFAFTTLITMLAIVLLGVWGIGFAKIGSWERYTHAIAGGTICFSGLAIMILGL
jgi:nickel/cobalt exporter